MVHPERMASRWPLLQTLKELRIEALKKKELEDEQNRKVEESNLDLGLGTQENKRRRVLPLGQDQIVVVTASAMGKTVKIRMFCRKGLYGLWVEQSQQTFDFLWRAFRHWKAEEGGVSPQRAPGAEPDEDAEEEPDEDAEEEEEDDSDSDGGGIAIPEEPRWWRSMWVFKFRVGTSEVCGARKVSQKSFSVKTSDDVAEFELRKEQRLSDALEWRSAFRKEARAQTAFSEGKE